MRRRPAARPKRRFLWVFVVAGFLLAVYLLITLTTKFWNGRDKFNFVFNRGDGNIEVVVLDPEISEMTILTVPGDTEVEVARNYGTLRLKNVWQLGLNEKVDGDLLAGTVTKNFLFPVFLWSGTDISQPFRFIFLPGKTNIPFGDRISAVFFAIKGGRLGKTTIDLAKGQFLRKEILTDGQPGYKASGAVSERLTIYFADKDFSEKGLKIYIKDATGVAGVAEKMGEILEVMGGKVVAVDRQAAEETGCEVLAKEPLVAKKIANLFSCSIVRNKTDFVAEDGFSVEIKIGKKFAERF